MRFEELVKSGTAALQGASQTPQLDAEMLLSHALGCSRSELHMRFDREADADDISRYRVYLERRKFHEPVYYIIGAKEFWSLEFAVNRSVLVPRPESELLVEKGLRFLETCQGELSILDLGTGSGCLAIALAHELQRAGRVFSMLALDTSADALETAADNALRHKVSGDVMLLESNWFSELDPGREHFDLIVSNPPYLAEGDPAAGPELRFEPAEALFSGPSGTEVIAHLMEHVSTYLNPRGIFLCEIGAGQRAELEAHFARVKNYVRPPLSGMLFHKDLAGIDRALELHVRPDLSR